MLLLLGAGLIPDLPGWFDGDLADLAKIGAGLVGVVLIWRYLVHPFLRGMHRGWKALLVVGDNYHSIEESRQSIAELARKIDYLLVSHGALADQNDIDHTYTRESLGAVAEWSTQFSEFDPIHLPDPPPRVSRPFPKEQSDYDYDIEREAGHHRSDTDPADVLGLLDFPDDQRT